VADRAADRPGPGDLDGGPGRPARAQDPPQTPGRVQGAVVVEPDTGLITGTELTKACGADSSDAAVGIRPLGLHNPDEGADTGTHTSTDTSTDTSTGTGTDTSFGEGAGEGAWVEVLADSAYGSGSMLAALERAGLSAVIKPWPLTPSVEGGFTIADFVVDEAAGTVTCPAGVVREMTRTRTAYFKAACKGCALRATCTTASEGRTVHVSEHDALHRAAHRAKASTPDFQAVYKQHRPMVERSIA
jgi:hypothetical protein